MTETTETYRNPANRLSQETSPYLLQHAHNPVNWYPWCEEALTKAREEDKPIFLSIGYSACHWCHVMEHESFENPEIAELMNRYFVSIKVDREERPDLDQIYMNAVLAMTGRGGWPMSVFLTPELKPFYGGTYWPAESRMGMPGFRDVLERVHEAWETRREQILNGAEELTGAVIKMGVPQGGAAQLNEDLLRNAMRALLRSADRTHGGFGGAPKFPHPMDLRVLLRCWKRFGNDEALEVTRLTLDKMARGGIYDHLGGGFHRYATDARWLVPHFEKMLYDNALLTPAYLEAFQATGDDNDARVVQETLSYVRREMTQPSPLAPLPEGEGQGVRGGFYSTQDADSEGVEGKYFVWSEAEVVAVLGAENARIFSYCYDVTPQGNWERKNILNRIKTHGQAAQMLGMSEDELTEILDRCKRKLFEVRKQRVPPGRDDKVLVSWNGLMIGAMAQAAAVLGEAEYAEAARNAADFILEHMRTDDGGLLHSYKDGRARFNAYLDDYAGFIDGLVELYQATFEARYLVAAVDLAERMVDRFHDAQSGGFYYTPADHETLIVRHKDSQDTATPSGNSLAATALLRLGRLCGRADFEQTAVGTLEMLSGQLARIPTAGGQALIALDFLLGTTYEVVVVDGEHPEDSQRVLGDLYRRFLPNKVVARKPHDLDDDSLPMPLQPLLQGKTAQDNAVTVYVCEHGTCQRPVSGVQDARSIIETL